MKLLRSNTWRNPSSTFIQFLLTFPNRSAMNPHTIQHERFEIPGNWITKLALKDVSLVSIQQVFDPLVP